MRLIIQQRALRRLIYLRDAVEELRGSMSALRASTASYHVGLHLFTVSAECLASTCPRDEVGSW